MQSKSFIEVFLRPLASDAYALVFFSRRTDMPYRFHSSLAQLNFSSSSLYEVSALQVATAFCFLGRALLGVVLTHMASPKRWPWVLCQVPMGQLQALRAMAGAVLCTNIFQLCKQNSWV